MKKILKNKLVQFGIILLVIIFLFSILFPKTQVAGYLRNGFYWVFSGTEGYFYRQGQGVKDGLSTLSEISGLRAERDQLLAEKRALMEENSKLQESEYENQVLREQLGLAEKQDQLDLIAVEIIGREVGGFSDIALINKGKGDGIEEKDNVVSGRFLVGRIKKVNSQTAQVQFITSVDSIVNGMLQGSRAKGIVKGGIGYGLEIESVPKDTKISNNELVITSGLGGGFPKGLIIGQVDKVLSAQSDIFHKSSLVTPVNFNSLEIVFIVK